MYQEYEVDAFYIYTIYRVFITLEFNNCMEDEKEVL